MMNFFKFQKFVQQKKIFFCQHFCDLVEVGVVTPITDLRQYLDHLSAQTNMKLLTTDAALGQRNKQNSKCQKTFKHFWREICSFKKKLIAFSEGDCGFLAANFCAHSIFGEDALANVSIEKVSEDDETKSLHYCTITMHAVSLHAPRKHAACACIVLINLFLFYVLQYNCF